MENARQAVEAVKHDIDALLGAAMCMAETVENLQKPGVTRLGDWLRDYYPQANDEEILILADALRGAAKKLGI